MKKVVAIAFGAMVFLNLSAGGAASSAAASDAGSAGRPAYAKRTIRIATNTSEQSIDTMAALKFADLVTEASGGAIQVKVFPNSLMSNGNSIKTLELLIAGGSCHMAVLSGTVLGNIDQRFLTHSIPFIFNSYDEASSYLDGTGGKYYAKLMAEKGLVYLASEHNGLRQLTNNRKDITKPSDLAGMKIRVPSGEVYMRTMAVFGADAIAMNWSEVFTAMQQGTIDGHENGYQTIISSNIQEVQKHITEWNWSYDGWFLMANEKDWAKFDAAERELFREKAVEACNWGRKTLEDNEAIIKKNFTENYGVTITILTDEQHARFVEAAKPVQEYFKAKFGPEACAAWGIE